MSVDVLVDALWAGEADPGAPKKLQLHVHRLRRALGDPARVRFEHSGYLLRVHPGELDADRFESMLAEGTDAVESGEPARGVEVIRKALGLWRGDPYGDLADLPLLRTEAERLAERRLAGLEELYAAELACGRHGAVVPELADLATQHPLRERLHGLLMTALYRTGRQADALEVYRRTRAALVGELGIEPGQELRRLQQAILAGDPALDAVAPATRARSAPPAQLPGDIADFTGREAQLALLRDLLSPGPRPAAVLVAGIAGKAGVGKTTLAVHVAHQLRGAFPDGQLYVDLRGAEANPVDAAEVLARFLRALGVDGPAIPEATEERAGLYRSRLAGKRMLVLLDNAACDAQLRPLLPGTPGCAVLVTSRARLVGLPGMTLVDLDILEPDQAVELLTRLAGPHRTATELTAVAEITRLCGYLPLAVRIAGARLAARPHWPLARMATALADEQHRLDELALGDLEVRSSLALSYGDLDPVARTAFRRLGLVEAPDFAAWVAAAVLELSLTEAEHVVERLVDAQLLDVAGDDLTGHSRYRFHDLIRVYARERVLAEEPEPARTAAVLRACGGWMALAEQAYRIHCGGDYFILHGSAPRWQLSPAETERHLIRPFAWFEAERLGLVAAVHDAARTGSDELCWDLAFTATLLFEARSYYDDWRDTHDCALAATRAAGNRRGEAAALVGLGALSQAQHRYDEAVEFGTAAVTLFEQTGERHGLAFALHAVATADRFRGHYDAVLARYSRARALLQETGDRGAEAYLLGCLGQIHLHHGHPERARHPLEEGLRISQESGSLRGRAQLLYWLGELELDEGVLEPAGQAFRQVLVLVRELGDLRGEAHAVRGLADVQFRQGLLDEAQTCLDTALRISRDVGERTVQTRALLSYGELLRTRGLLDQAATHLQQALDIARELDVPLLAARALHSLGVVHDTAGRPEAASGAWNEALALFT
ncbi:MAG: tetratricopeptide repeat protein, partial [Actinomycetota bacterium]|nr:tetratricopeptide repeat protein [Actinomycetota bacterium]